MLDKGGVQRLVLVLFDDVCDDRIRECDKILLGTGSRFKDLVEIRVGRA